MAIIEGGGGVCCWLWAVVSVDESNRSASDNAMEKELIDERVALVIE
jgi:hypothetical protein